MLIPDEYILSQFVYETGFSSENCKLQSIDAGHINRTFSLAENGKNEPKYIIQCINTHVFKDPEALMANIAAVTAHIREKTGADSRSTLEIVKTKDGKLFFCDRRDGNAVHWRCYKYIKNAVGLDAFDRNNMQTYVSAGAALGNFQKMLMDFDASALAEIIPSFHDTEHRYEAFEAALQKNTSGRAADAASEIAFAKERKSLCGIVTKKLQSGLLPLRVTHNDTKLSNIIADAVTGEVLCLIDLDTVMPGSILYDFGDALRTAACSGAEDEPDTDRIFFREDIFAAFCSGYLSAAASFLTREEIALLPESVILLTYECGTRFLTDYIDGDTYFATAYPAHNLVRTRTQFKMIADMEKKLPRMRAIVEETAKKYGVQ